LKFQDFSKKIEPSSRKLQIVNFFNFLFVS
jgi:hypothetical protein